MIKGKGYWNFGVENSWNLHLLAFLLSFLVLSRFNFDVDLGWHLAIGEHFLNSGEIIRADRFSWTMPGYVWGNSYFLYQVLVAFLFSKIGFLATVFVFAAISSLAFLIVLPKRINLLGVLLVILASYVVSGNLGIRPHAISFLFFAILMRLLISNRFASREKFWFWFLFFCLWANFHNAFLIGLFAFGSFRGIELIFGLVNKKAMAIDALIINSLAAFFGTFFTPFGIYLWMAILNDAFFAKMYLNIAEWLSFVFRGELRLFYALTAVIFIYVMHKQFKQIGPSLVFASSFFFMLPFMSAYFVFFWGLMFVLVASRYWDVQINKGTRFLFKLLLVAGSGMVMVLVIFNFSRWFLKTGELSASLEEGGYPVEAVKFMKENGVKEHIFNEYQWGGYLDWQYREAAVFIDGRMTGWKVDGRSLLLQYLEIKRGNCEVANRYDIKALLIVKESDVSCFGDFEKVYGDKVAEVWIKQ